MKRVAAAAAAPPGDTTNITRLQAGFSIARTVVTFFSSAAQKVGFTVTAGAIALVRQVQAGFSVSTKNTGVVTPETSAGFEVTTENTGTADPVLTEAGFTAEAQPAQGDINPTQEVGFTQTTENVGTPRKVETRAGLQVTTRNLGTPAPPLQRSGIAVTRLQYDLVHRSGGNAVHQELGCTGRVDWTNTANALGKATDESIAQLSGNALAARDGILVLNYANFVDKTELTIDQVRLIFYCQQTGTLANNGNHDHRWRKVSGGAWTVLETFTGNHNTTDSGTGGLAYDITAGITSWTDLNFIETGCRQCLDLAEVNITALVNAIELEVTASRTDVI